MPTKQSHNSSFIVITLKITLNGFCINNSCLFRHFLIDVTLQLQYINGLPAVSCVCSSERSTQSTVRCDACSRRGTARVGARMVRRVGLWTPQVDSWRRTTMTRSCLAHPVHNTMTTRMTFQMEHSQPTNFKDIAWLSHLKNLNSLWSRPERGTTCYT